MCYYLSAVKGKRKSLFVFLLVMVVAALEIWFAYSAKLAWGVPLGKDAHQHVENAQELFARMESGGVGFVECCRTGGQYPPLVYFLSALSCRFFGSCDLRVLYVPLAVLILVLNFSLYFLAREFFGRVSSVVPVLLIGACPIFLQEIGLYTLEFAAFCFIPLLLLLLLRSDGLADTRGAAMFFVVLALSCLVYIWTLVRMLVPIVVALLLIGRPYRRSLRNLFFGAIAVGLVLLPYLTGDDFLRWLGTEGIGFLAASKPAVVEADSHFHEAGWLYYVKLLFSPLSGGLAFMFYAFLLSLFSVDLFKDRRWWVIVACAVWLVVSNSMFTTMYPTRLLSFVVPLVVLVGAGILGRRVWVRCLCLLFVLASFVIGFRSASGSAGWHRAAERQYLAMMRVLEGVCEDEPRLQVFTLTPAGWITYCLRAYPERFGCISEKDVSEFHPTMLDRTRSAVLVHRGDWRALCERLGRVSETAYVGRRWICDNVDELEEIYHDGMTSLLLVRARGM